MGWHSKMHHEFAMKNKYVCKQHFFIKRDELFFMTTMELNIDRTTKHAGHVRSEFNLNFSPVDWFAGAVVACITSKSAVPASEKGI